MKIIQQWLVSELLPQVNHICNKFCVHGTTCRLISMMKFILEVENTNYLDSDIHITCFLSVLKGRGEKIELYFPRLSSLFQTNKYLETPICCGLFLFTIHKERVGVHWNYIGFGLISIHWVRGLYFMF